MPKELLALWLALARPPAALDRPDRVLPPQRFGGHHGTPPPCPTDCFGRISFRIHAMIRMLAECERSRMDRGSDHNFFDIWIHGTGYAPLESRFEGDPNGAYPAP